MWVENRSDDLWVGVKGQSSLEIAGSPRNLLRSSLEELCTGGRATGWARAGVAGTNPNQTPNTCYMYLGRQSLSDNVQRREGKNPEPQLRPQSGR